jgi:hypothetical protein
LARKGRLLCYRAKSSLYRYVTFRGATFQRQKKEGQSRAEKPQSRERNLCAVPPRGSSNYTTKFCG